MKYIFIALISIGLAACTMDDDERCAKPYAWSAPQAACIIPVDTDIPEPQDTSPVQEGLGAECWANSDCTVYEPDGPAFCLLDPTDPSVEGMCTFTDCAYKDCGGPFECCDCESSGTAASLFGDPLVFCADNISAGLLNAIGCSCE